jgi:hypothetical protein
MGEIRNPYKILVGKPEGTTPLGRRRRILEDNINMALRKISSEGVDLIIWLRIGTCSGLL